MRQYPLENIGDIWVNEARTKADSAQCGLEARQYFSDEGDVVVADTGVRDEASPTRSHRAAVHAE